MTASFNDIDWLFRQTHGEGELISSLAIAGAYVLAALAVTAVVIVAWNWSRKP